MNHTFVSTPLPRAADAGDVASIVHYGEHPIPDLKRYLSGAVSRCATRVALAPGKERQLKIALVVSDFNFDVTSIMAERARRHLNFLVRNRSRMVHVPGVFDMPLAVKSLLKRKDIDGVVMIGVGHQGRHQSRRVDRLRHASAAVDLALEFDKPVGLGVTGPGMDRMQALDRIDNAKNAAESVVRMLRTLKELE